MVMEIIKLKYVCGNQSKGQPLAFEVVTTICGEQNQKSYASHAAISI